MMRWQREVHDAELDGCASVMRGSPCPVCGDATTEGAGPCSVTCEVLLAREERRQEIRDEIADEERGEREADWAEGFR
jgi:hypothetical protein